MNTRVLLAASLAAVASSALGCLPGDTRPVPERVEVTAEPEASVRAGLATDDGWRITYDRLLMALGNVGFSSEDAPCTSYAETHYDRLFDFTVAGREKVGTIYGLGTCRVDFRVRSPSFDALLEPGATASDVALMRQKASDRFEDDRPISVLLIGAASHGAARKSFTWAFRTSYRVTDCEALGGGLLTTVELTEATSSELRFEVRPRELFRAAADDGAPLVFQPIADADADADGDITLDELSKAPLSNAGLGGLGPDGGLVDAGGLEQGGGAPDAGGEAPPSLESLIYGSLVPRLVRAAGGGPCDGE